MGLILVVMASFQCYGVGCANFVIKRVEVQKIPTRSSQIDDGGKCALTSHTAGLEFFLITTVDISCGTFTTATTKKIVFLSWDLDILLESQSCIFPIVFVSWLSFPFGMAAGLKIEGGAFGTFSQIFSLAHHNLDRSFMNCSLAFFPLGHIYG